MATERLQFQDQREVVDWKDLRKPRRMVLSSAEEVAEHDRRALGTGPEAEILKRQWVELGAETPLREMPLELMVEAVGAVCDMKCPMCYLQSEEFHQKVRIPLAKEKATIMNQGLYAKVIDEIAQWNFSRPIEERILSIKFGFRGEPTLDKNLLKKIEMAKEAGVYYISFLTNANPMDDEFFQRLIELDVNEVVFSGEGSDPKTYERIRYPAKFDEFIAKLARWKKMRDSRGAERPVMRIQSVWPAIGDNPERFYEIFRDRVDLVVSNALIDYLHNDRLEQIDYIADFKCYEPFQRLIIAGNGQVIQCINDEYSTNFVGDLRKQSLNEIWHDEGMQKLRDAHLEGRATAEYQACAHCYLPRQIEWIEPIEIDGRKVEVFRYLGRAQEIGK